MTTSDPATGLPLLADSSKTVPIPLNLLPELRELEETRIKAEAAAKTIGFQLVLLTATAAAVGQAAFLSDKAWQAMLAKIAAMHDLKFDAVLGTDLDKAVIVLK